MTNRIVRAQVSLVIAVAIAAVIVGVIDANGGAFGTPDAQERNAA